MPVHFQTRIVRDDLRKNPNTLFLFGDNDARKGNGGQAAEMRGEPNSVGVRTKAKPSRDPDAYWSDKDFDANCKKIEADLDRVKRHLRKGGLVVIPAAGLGTGLSEMRTRCPKTFYILEQSIMSLQDIQ